MDGLDGLVRLDRLGSALNLFKLSCVLGWSPSGPHGQDRVGAEPNGPAGRNRQN